MVRAQVCWRSLAVCFCMVSAGGTMILNLTTDGNLRHLESLVPKCLLPARTPQGQGTSEIRRNLDPTSDFGIV